MFMKRSLALLLACSWTTGLFADPAADLGSPLQQFRDAAAKTLRETYVPPRRTNWNTFVSKIKRGDPQAKVLALFPPPGPQQEAFIVGPTNSTASYRLDDLWILVCQWDDFKHTLISFQTAEQMRHVWIAPSREYTGVWTTYYVNGQTCSVINFRSGKYFGEFTSYRPDGSKSCVQHYGPNGCEGDDTGYYPSGKVFYKGVQKNGIQTGIWTWYNEDGSIRAQKEFPEQ